MNIVCDISNEEFAASANLFPWRRPGAPVVVCATLASCNSTPRLFLVERSGEGDESPVEVELRPVGHQGEMSRGVLYRFDVGCMSGAMEYTMRLTRDGLVAKLCVIESEGM